jgi:hypothetical protein
VGDSEIPSRGNRRDAAFYTSCHLLTDSYTLAMQGQLFSQDFLTRGVLETPDAANQYR